MSSEVISAWDVYWVLQLDRIGSTMFWLPVAASGFTFFGAMVSEGATVWDFEKKRLHGYVKYLCAAMFASWLACLFLPSSKTAAAIIVLPAIANNETVQTEAADLYKLAKQAMQKAVGEEKETKE
jgi:hypothetical protein